MFKELLNLCRERSEKGNIYIQTHNFPDPDAIASAFGLQQLLKACGIKTTICYEGETEKINTAIMINVLKIQMKEYREIRSSLNEHEDSIICVDSQKWGGNITDFIGEEIACIDHHPVCSDVRYLYSDIRKTGACASLITSYFDEMDMLPDKKTATALLYGIKMDTDQFSRGVTEFDIDMFKLLFSLADNSVLTLLEHSNLRYDDLKAYAAAIEGVKIISGCGFSYIPFACPDGMVAALADFILSLHEVRTAVICSERDDGIRISVRSQTEDIHAGEFIRNALGSIGHGGGHASMAGGLIPSDEKKKLGNEPEKTIYAEIMRVAGKT